MPVLFTGIRWASTTPDSPNDLPACTSSLPSVSPLAWWQYSRKPASVVHHRFCYIGYQQSHLYCEFISTGTISLLRMLYIILNAKNGFRRTITSDESPIQIIINRLLVA